MGGESSRFWPLNYNSHKSLFKLMGKTILEHTLDKVIDISKEIIIVKNPEAEIKDVLEKYKNNANIKVVLQEKPNGMGDAVLLAKKYIGKEDRILIINPYHIEINLFKKYFDSDDVLFGVETENPEDYGILEIEGSKVLGVEEKPEKPKSNIKIVGLYYLSSGFLNYLEKEKEKGHYFFEIALNKYVKENKVVFVKLEKDVVSLKYPWHVFDIKNILLKSIKSNISGKKASSVVFDESKGPIFLGNNVKIMENVVIRGPCYIGNNVVIGNNSLIRDSVIEDNVSIGFGSEIARSVFGEGSSIHSGFVGDSIIGEYSKLGAGFVSSNKRFDRQDVVCNVKNKRKKTGLKSLGVIIGKNSHVGIKCGTMPGVFLGNNSIIYPGKIVYKNVEDNEVYK